MNMKRLPARPRAAQALLILTLLGILIAGCAQPTPKEPPEPPRLLVGTEMDLTGGPAEALEVGETLSIGLENARSGERVEFFLNDDAGQEWSYARAYADENGRIDPLVFWYHSGVIGTTSLDIDFRPDPAFVTFEEAEAYFAAHGLILTAIGSDGRQLARQRWNLTPRRSPMVYPSNAEGVLMNGIHAANEDVFVTGRHFPAGSSIHVAMVPNQYDWELGDPIRDITGPGRQANVKTIELAQNQTEFTIPVWSKNLSRAGAYDFVARIDAPFNDPHLWPGDILSYNADTAVMLYLIINGNIVIDVAGRMKSAPAKFEFSDSFEKGEDVYGAVDPSDVPAVHSGGNYAAYYITDDFDPVYWDGVSPAVADVSGGFEIQRVKYWCINASRRNIWPSATQTEPIKGYDVVVDFGSVPAMTSADFTPDGVYNKGTDFLDGYDVTGFYVFEDPASTGPFAVGTAEVDEPNGIPGMPFDPMGMTGPNYLVDLAWGYLMYPATAAGALQPVSNVEPSYPVALFLHGRHANCDSNGSAVGGMASYEWPGACADANRIPNHRGYDYILERLASHGIIAISIDAFEIQKDNSIWNYDLRGRLVLKWLDKLRDWNDNGTDPFGGIFQGKIDMSRIALSGHSRGGEGVIGAQHLNAGWPAPHSIVAVNPIAPTDQNNLDLGGGNVYFGLTDGNFLLTLGARDGDIWEFDGMRFYDRAYPASATNGQSKAVTFIYGANHNYFNTVWTPSPDLGSVNPWAGAVDEGAGGAGVFQMPAADQRAIARTTIAAFFRRYLQDLEPYKEIFTGRLEPASMDNANVFWTYQDPNRTALDNFEQLPQNPLQNTQMGPVTDGGFTEFAERLLSYERSSYAVGLPTITNVYHDTLGMKLTWGANTVYTTQFPGGIDATGHSHLTLRAGKVLPSTFMEAPGPDVNLLINVLDGDGDDAMWSFRSDQFDAIPHPYWGGYYEFVMNSVRIPLRQFTLNNSGVDLDDIHQITIEAEGNAAIVLDDIEFGD